MKSTQMEFICDICQKKKVFKKKSHLKDHIELIHNFVGYRKCVKCSSQFKQACNFVAHFKQHHLNCSGSIECTSKIPCTVCVKLLECSKNEWIKSEPTTLTSNMEKVNFQCDICEKYFTRKFHLKSHINLKHYPAKGVKCTQCDAVYQQIGNFVVHLKKEHICKKSNCTTKAACKECREKIVTAKELWHRARKKNLLTKAVGEPNTSKEITAAKNPAIIKRRKIMQDEDIRTNENKRPRQNNSINSIQVTNEDSSKKVTITEKKTTKNHRGKGSREKKIINAKKVWKQTINENDSLRIKITYTNISANVYSKSIKKSKTEAMKCECKLICDSECINRNVFIECSPEICTLGKSCTNTQIQKRKGAPIEKILTEKKGYGIRSKDFIRKNTFISEYVGEVLYEKEFQQRMNTIYSNEYHHYCMKMEGNLVIDAYRMGNLMRFVNHSCSPNCEIQKWVVKGKPRMALFSKQDIEINEELTFNYKFSRYNLEESQACYCGAVNCCGVIGGRLIGRY